MAIKLFRNWKFNYKNYTLVVASIIFLWFLLPHTMVKAIPADSTPYILRQPDGTVFYVRNIGDEWNNKVVTLDNKSIVFDKSRSAWVYAKEESKGYFSPTNTLVGKTTFRKIVLFSNSQNKVKTNRFKQLSQQINIYDKYNNLINTDSPKDKIEAPPAFGVHRLLAIVVDFTPSVSRGTTELQWEQHFFTGGTSVHPFSVKNYWDTVSYGRIILEPAAETFGTVNNGIVFVTLNYAHPNTGENTGDANRLIVRNAIIAADPFVNFASFDTNRDGYLNTNELHLYIIVRGYERAASSVEHSPSVWAHRWSLGWGAVAAPQVDGIIVSHLTGAPFSGPYRGGYSQGGEWLGNRSHMATIGITCHELGHDLGTGLPDLYDTDTSLGTSSAGVGDWSLMGSGGWNGRSISGYSGTHPSWPDPWSRWFLGFIIPQRITATTTITFPQVQTATGENRGVFQLLDNPNGVDWDWRSGTGEYFLIENRQKIGFDAGLPGDGLLIWHICESVRGDNRANADEGTAPPGNPRLIVLEQADGRFDLENYRNPPYLSQYNRGDSTDPFKLGTSTIFDNNSTPSSKLYAGTSSLAFVRNISASGSVMTATIGIDTVQTNRPPSFTNLPATQTIPAGQSFAFQVQATDPDGDALTYSLSNQPTGMTISTNGLISWPTPVAGSYTITVGVSDGVNPLVTATLTLTVTPQNSSPIFTNLPATQTIPAGQSFTFQVQATDPDGDALTYSLSGAPSEMFISTAGLISWSNPVRGSYTITVSVSDGVNPAVTSTLTLTVNSSPFFTNLPATQTIPAGQSFAFQVQATDPEGDILNYSLNNHPVNMFIDSNSGFIYWFSPNKGYYTINVFVSDGVNPLVFSTLSLKVQTTLVFTIDKKDYTVNGVRNTLDVAPTIIEGRTFLPIRYVVEPLGGILGWDGTAKKVTIVQGTNTIEMWIGNPVAKVNGRDVFIDLTNTKVVPIIKDGRALLPLRFVSEQLGAEVVWDGTLKTVAVKYPK